MKILLVFLIAIPTLIAALLFTVAILAYRKPAMLAAKSNPAIAILCIISGALATLPLVSAGVLLLERLIGSKQKKNKKHSKGKEK